MIHLVVQILTKIWNAVASRAAFRRNAGVRVGLRMIDGRRTRRPIRVLHGRRKKHLAILGTTGAGKTSLIRYLCEQDVRSDRGFLIIDQHGDLQTQIVNAVANEERRRSADLSSRLIIIDPGDRLYSAGFNPLDISDRNDSFKQAAAVAQILKDRWNLDTLGVRTEELLRNGILILIDNNYTLLELPLLLSSDAFRAACLARARNQDARDYFMYRYNQHSKALQAVYREAVLNKITSFTSDPRFKHLLGQRQSTVRLGSAIDSGAWIIVNLNKGVLGEQSATLGALLLATFKQAVFGRRERKLFTLYADELQNLVVYDTGLESLMAESRKKDVSICSANQHLDQYPPAMRSTVLAAGTHVLFRLASFDARRMSYALGGGQNLYRTLLNLPPRQFIAKTEEEGWVHGCVPFLTQAHRNDSNLQQRSLSRFARHRSEVEKEILLRQQTGWQMGDFVDE